MTPRDDDLLSALTLKVRVLSLPMVARTWWTDTPAGRTAAERRLAELVGAGWLLRHAVTSAPELPLREPVFVWEVGDRPPHFGSLAYQLQTRFPDEAVQLSAFRATRHATGLYGGVAPPFKLDSLRHDLHVGALYVRFHRDRPDDARDWISEDLLARDREDQVLPDAALIDERGALRRVIEFGGRYEAERLLRLHEDCVGRSLPYELW